MANQPFPFRRRRSPLLPPWLRPQYRRFKPSPPLKRRPLPRIKEVSPPSRRRSPSLRPTAVEERWSDPEGRRGVDLSPLMTRSRMQTTFGPDGLLSAGTGGFHTGIHPLVDRPPVKPPEVQNGGSYPGLYRPGVRDPPDLRDLIRRKTRPLVPPPQPPLLPPPLLLCSGPCLGQIHGPRVPVEDQPLPLWADPDKWASVHSKPGCFPGNLFPSLRLGPAEGPVAEPVGSSSHLACMPTFHTVDRRIWAPGDIRPLERPMYLDSCLLPPRFAPRIVASPGVIQPELLFEQGRTPKGPASQITRAARLGEELEDPGIYRLGQQ